MAADKQPSANIGDGNGVDLLGSPNVEQSQVVEKHIVYQINPITNQVLGLEVINPITGERKEVDVYDMHQIHRMAARDYLRTDTFRNALSAVVHEGDVVLDLRAGMGVLSLLAAQAGASKVYAVEPGAVAGLTRQLVARNNLQDTVEVIQKKIREVQLPARVDVIVSGWLGPYDVDGRMLATVLLARDRWLKPGGRIVPEQITAWMAPASSDVCRETRFFHRHPYGLDLAPLAEPSVQDLVGPLPGLTDEDLQAEPQAMWATDLYRYPTEQAAQPFQASLVFTVDRQVRVDGLATWHRTEFGNGLVLSNAPQQAAGSWRHQIVLPLERATVLEPGAEIAVRFSGGSAYAPHSWSVRAGSGAWQHHDTAANGPPRPFAS